MSLPHPHESVKQEEDILPPRLIVYVIVGVLAFSLLLVGFAYAILRAREQALRPNGRFAEQRLGPITERSNVQEELFTNRGRGQVDALAQKQSLEHFAWADRQRRIVHVPIDVAMELLIKSQKSR